MIMEGLYSFQIGGSERLGALLCRQFAARGYRTAAVSFFDLDGPIREELEADGIACYGLNAENRSRLGKLTLRWDVERLLRRTGPDVLHLHHGVTMIRAARGARRAGVGHVCMTEHSDLQLRTEDRYRRWAVDELALVDSVTVINEPLVRYFRDDLGCPPAKLALVPNAVDPRFDGARSAAPRAVDAGFRLAFVGRLVPEKDVATLLRAVAQLKSQGIGVTLELVGDGQERAGLERLAAELDLGGAVRFRGALRDTREVVAQADAFVMSSVSEGTPLALMEAMSAGLPCVATRIGGIPQLMEGVGVLLDPRDPAGLAAALAELYRDPARARLMGEQARARIAERYSVGTVVDAYLQVFGLPARWTAARA
jgi:glycosyltransferase involved in cell wall biosynthesis